MTSDLLNDPSRPACGCDHCTKYASSWATGSILARIRRWVATVYVDRGVRARARLYGDLAGEQELEAHGGASEAADGPEAHRKAESA